MNIKVFILVFILLILVIYLLYRFLHYKENFQTSSSTVPFDLENFLKTNVYQRNLINGYLTYYGSIFEYKNSHNFVYKNDDEIKYLGIKSGVKNIESIEQITNAEIYSNHGAFCIIDSDNRIKSFGLKEYGGELPVGLSNKNIRAVFSTENKFCALDSNKEAYIWPKSDTDNSFEQKSNISKVFSNKTHFSFIEEENKLSTYPATDVPDLEDSEEPIIIYSNENNFIAVYNNRTNTNTKVKIWGSEVYSANKHNLESLDNIKAVYTNYGSILVIYNDGNGNKIACCGDPRFFTPGIPISQFQEIKEELDKIENVVAVYSNKGAYCLLKGDGTVINIGKSSYISQKPDSSVKFKSISSNYGAFAGITYDNDLVTWGIQKHGGKLNVNTSDIKDVVPNGDSEGGAFFVIKEDQADSIVVGNIEYGGNIETSIKSNTINTVTSNDRAFFIITGERNLKLHALTGAVNTKYIAGYPDRPLDITETFYNQNNISKFYSNILSSNANNEFSLFFNKMFETAEFVSQTQNVFEPTTQTVITLPSTFKYWSWELKNNADNNIFHPSNNSNEWKIDSNNGLNNNINFTGLNGTFLNGTFIEYEVKTLDSPVISICFSAEFLEIDKSFDIINIHNINISKEKNKLVLNISGDRITNRDIIISSNNFSHFVYVFSLDNILLYKNASLQNEGQLPIKPVINVGNTNLVLGQDLTETRFNIKDLMIFDNYNLNQEEINNIFSNNEFNLILNTTPISNNTVPTTNPSSSIPVTTKVEENFIELKFKKNFFNINKFIVRTEVSDNNQVISVSSKLKKNANFKNSIKLNIDTNMTLRKKKFTGEIYSYVDIDIKSHFINYRSNKQIIDCLTYLDVQRVKNISENHGSSDIYIFIYGEIESQSNIINEFYFIIYKDEDDVMRFEEIKQDLNFLHRIFIPVINSIDVDSSSSDETAQSEIQEIYNSFKDQGDNENKRKQYSNILNTDDREEGVSNIIENVKVSFYENNQNTKTLLVYNSKKNTNFRCSYIPQGETLFECKLICKSQKLNCTELQCNNLCETCEKDNCTWNIVRKENEKLIRPEKSIIKGFSGNKMIKVTWVKPVSKSSLVKYYLILTKPSDNEFIEIYTYENSDELLEFIIADLDNEIPYSVSVVSKNKIGISDISNTETVIPNENNDLNVELSFDTGDNSLQNLSRNIESDKADLSQQKSIYEKDIIIRELESIIHNSLNIDIPKNTLNINIF